MAGWFWWRAARLSSLAALAAGRLSLLLIWSVLRWAGCRGRTWGVELGVEFGGGRMHCGRGVVGSGQWKTSSSPVRVGLRKR